jgi:hypothetical protein
MDKRVIIILVLVIVIVAGVGGALLLMNRTPTAPVATPFPSATPVSTQIQPALTTQMSTPLTASGSGTIDVYIDTKSVKIDGFQFIATLGGTALPTISDADSATEGVQITAETIPDLSTSTNTVTEQDGAFVIRYAMVASDSTIGYSTDSPTRVASIPVLAGSGGTVSVTFNQQNSRARLLSGGEDALITTTDGSFPVTSESVATNPISSPSSSLVAQTQVTATPVPTSSAATTTPFCLASCFSDGDCAAGLVCETDRCVNPACPTSATCGCGANQATQTVTTTHVPTIASTPVPVATEIPADVVPTAPASGSAATDLPASGSTEYTLLAIGAGLLLIGGGVLLTAKQEV